MVDMLSPRITNPRASNLGKAETSKDAQGVFPGIRDRITQSQSEEREKLLKRYDKITESIAKAEEVTDRQKAHKAFVAIELELRTLINDAKDLGAAADLVGRATAKSKEIQQKVKDTALVTEVRH